MMSGTRHFLCGLGLLAIAGMVAADVTIVPGADPKPYAGVGGVSSVDQLFRTSMDEEFYKSNATILMSSYDGWNITAQDGIHTSSDSFVRGSIQAWGEHQHLVIRPEEVWFTILVQMNFYMNKNAEAIRDLFVDFQGQQTITVLDDTWYWILTRFKDEIQKRVKTDWLLDWILPKFTTTTESDIMTANILMMSLTQAYFKFEGGITCGLPSVTLLGTKADWQSLLAKLDHLADFGADPAAYGARLRPILTRFVSSFDAPDSAETLAFWNSIVTAKASITCGGPPFYLTGWITGFFYWDVKGAPYGRSREQDDFTLDGVTYPHLAIDSLPVGYAKAPFKMIEYPKRGQNFSAYVAAGTLGEQITKGPPAGYLDAVKRSGNAQLLANAGSDDHYTLRPLSAWLLYGPANYTAKLDGLPDKELRNISNGITVHEGAAQCLPSHLFWMD